MLVVVAIPPFLDVIQVALVHLKLQATKMKNDGNLPRLDSICEEIISFIVIGIPIYLR